MPEDCSSPPPPFVVLARLAHPSPSLLCTVSNISSISLLNILDLGLGLRLGLHSQTHVASGHQVLSVLSDLRPCVLLCSKQGDDGKTGAISVSRNSCYGQTIPDTDQHCGGRDTGRDVEQD